MDNQESNTNEVNNKISNSLEIVVMVILDKGYIVTEKLYDSIKLQVTEILPALILNERYTLRTLCGPEFWNKLDREKKKDAGRCMAHMVKNEIFPLTFAGKTSSHSWLYQLK